MANHIYIFCSSPNLMPLRELGQYMATIGLLDQAPSFDPPLDSVEAQDPAWTDLVINYQAGKRPIQLYRAFEQHDMAPAIEDALTMLADNDRTGDHPEIVQRINASRQIFHFELGLELPDDCWEMLDATEAHIATTLDGIVFASEGFYDKDLEPIFTWG